VPVFQTGCCGFESRRSLQFFRRVVSIGKTSVSKTEVFSSNLNAPANFIRARQNAIANLTPHIFSSRKASQIGMAAVLKTAARKRIRVRVLCLPPNFRGRSSTELEQFTTNEQVGGSNPLALSKNFYGFVAQWI
jgi:hypothetical protein